MNTSYKRGFTLIELLVVIAIIGVLSSIVLASLNSARQKGRDARRIADIKQIQLALELFYDGNGQYPTAIDNRLVTNGYISNIPVDPSSGNAYAYSALGGTTCTSYHLGATLETRNIALNGDNDSAAGTACSGTSQTPAASASDFSGLAANANNSGASCSGAAGTAGSSGSETCYDMKP